MKIANLAKLIIALLFAGSTAQAGLRCSPWLIPLSTTVDAWADDLASVTSDEAAGYAYIAAIRRSVRVALQHDLDLKLHDDFGDEINDYRLPAHFQFEALPALNEAVDVMRGLKGVVRRTEDVTQVDLKDDGVLTLLVHEDAEGPEILEALEVAKFWGELRTILMNEKNNFTNAGIYARYFLETPQGALVAGARAARHHLSALEKRSRRLSTKEVNGVRNFPLQRALEKATELAIFAREQLARPDYPPPQIRRQLELAAAGLPKRIDELVTETIRGTVATNDRALEFPGGYFAARPPHSGHPYFENPLVREYLRERFVRLSKGNFTNKISPD